MTQREWMKEGIDLKLTILLYAKKIWISIVCALVGAALCGGLYYVIHDVLAPQKEYEAVSKVYLTFAADDNGDAYQYYNGYTWNDLMGTEPILDVTMEQLAGYDRDFVRKSITADILSDIRLLTLTVCTNDPVQTEAIIRACESSLVHFGQEMVEFEKIEVIEHGQANVVLRKNEIIRAVVAGFVIGWILSLLGLAIVCILDDVVYVPADIRRCLSYPVLGIIYAGDEERGKEQLLQNIETCKQSADEPLRISAEESDWQSKIGTAPEVIVEVPYGHVSLKKLEELLENIKIQKKEIAGLIITDADARLYDLYFGVFGQKRKRK